MEMVDTQEEYYLIIAMKNIWDFTFDTQGEYY